MAYGSLQEGSGERSPCGAVKRQALNQRRAGRSRHRDLKNPSWAISACPHKNVTVLTPGNHLRAHRTPRKGPEEGEKHFGVHRSKWEREGRAVEVCSKGKGKEAQGVRVLTGTRLCI